jgi:hypothetical protein
MSWFQRIFLSIFLIFLSILSVTGTIALRNILHLALLGMLLGYVMKNYLLVRDRVMYSAKILPLTLVLWCVYILVFPLFAPDGHGALGNMLGKGMWGESLLTWILAGGAVLILGGRRLGLWRLALVSATPTFIHIFLLILAWGRILQPSFYEDPSIRQVFDSLLNVIQGISVPQDAFKSFPYGFRGIEPMHGNLGYPASQAICLSLAVALAAWRNEDYNMLLKSSALIFACLFSVVIAQSRAAAYFGIVLILLALAVYWMSCRNNSTLRTSAKHSTESAWRIAGVLGLTAVLSGITFYKVVSENVTWYSMWDKVSLGFEIDNPQELLCEGFSDRVQSFVRSKYTESNEDYIATLVNGLNGDGARVLMARTGVSLLQRYPWGLNGGRDAYQLRMKEFCGHVPALDYSHAHNAWINIILSLGFLGGGLYALLLFVLARRGWGMLKSKQLWPHGIALFLLAVFWMLRAFVDAVFQEHYLQMQASAMFLVLLSSQYYDTNQDLKSGLDRMSA